MKRTKHFEQTNNILSADRITAVIHLIATETHKRLRFLIEISVAYEVLISTEEGHDLRLMRDGLVQESGEGDNCPKLDYQFGVE